jgi:hypothetical protein
MFCRIVIALLFTVSASGKTMALTDFEVAISDFKLLPRRWSHVIARSVLGAEALVIVLVSLGGTYLVFGFLLAIALLAVFTVALTSALRGNTNLSCNCFGRTQKRISRYDVARSFLLILCSLTGLAMLHSDSRGLAWSETILVALMSLVFVTLMTNLGDIIETLRHPFPVSSG